MTSSTDLKQIAKEARPVVVDGLKIAKQLASFGKLCRDKGIDWAQLKALLKAEHKDGEDGGDRVEKIIEKADFATAYADMLGIAKMNNEIISSPAPREDREVAEYAAKCASLIQAEPLPVVEDRPVEPATVTLIATSCVPTDALPEEPHADIPGICRLSSDERRTAWERAQ